MEIPKSFWKYYDMYRRKKISLQEFSLKANISIDLLLIYLQEIS